MNSTTLAQQLDEFRLIQCSLLPDELLTFLDDAELWDKLLGAHADGADLLNFKAPSSPARIQIKVNARNVWFEAEVPRDYAGSVANPSSLMSVKGQNLTRQEQEHWREVIRSQLEVIGDTEYPIYQLLSLHLLPLLHTEFEAQKSLDATSDQMPSSFTSPSTYHALLTSHHLISPTKRRSLQQWSSSLSITGFAKVGYPGLIYAEGRKESIEEFVASVKSMQWLALRVRFVEPLDVNVPVMGRSGQRRWIEFQKVGEVVEEMRQIGREQFVTEIGIGSTNAK